MEPADILRTSGHQVLSPTAQAPTESSDFELETREETKKALGGIAHWTQVNTIIIKSLGPYRTCLQCRAQLKY